MTTNSKSQQPCKQTDDTSMDVDDEGATQANDMYIAGKYEIREMQNMQKPKISIQQQTKTSNLDIIDLDDSEWDEIDDDEL